MSNVLNIDSKRALTDETSKPLFLTGLTALFLIAFDGFVGRNLFKKYSKIICFVIYAGILALAVYIFSLAYDIFAPAYEGGGARLLDFILVGAVLNLIPDFISLAQTRWIVKKLSRERLGIRQVGWLLLDFILTGLIILIPLVIYHRFTQDVPIGIGSMLESMLAFRMTSVFFYSTFVTSIWLWLFAISVWTLRILSSEKLRSRFNVLSRPFLWRAAIAGVITTVFIGFGVTVIDGIKVDRLACAGSPWICAHFERNTEDEDDRVFARDRRCAARVGEGLAECPLETENPIPMENYQAFLFGIQQCNAGDAEACLAVGNVYSDPDSRWFFNEKGEVQQKISKYIAQDKSEALSFWDKGCDRGSSFSCVNAGLHFYDTVPSGDLALNYLNRACLKLTYDAETDIIISEKPEILIGSVNRGCQYLGHYYSRGKFTPVDYLRAYAYYAYTCQNYNGPAGCYMSGFIKENGWAGKKDEEKAKAFYGIGCEAFDGQSCYALALLSAECVMSATS